MMNNKKPVKIKNDGYKKKGVTGFNTYAEKTKTGDPPDLPENPHYTGIARKIEWGKSILIVLLIFFILGAALLNFGDLSVAKFNNFLRGINIFGPGASAKPEFYVDSDDPSSIGYYKNNIAVVKKNALDIYNTGGRLVDQFKLTYSNPVLKTSEKYILIYDLGTDKMEIFDASLTRVHTYKSGRPVYSAEVTDKGGVVYITSEKGYNSAVYVMDNKFRYIFGCTYGEDFIVGADIDEDAKMLAVAGFAAHDGDYLSKIILYETDSETIVKETEVAGERPYLIKLNANGVFAVFDNSFRAYGLDGAEISGYALAGRKIQAVSLTSVYAALAVNEKTPGTTDRVLVFDGNGDIIYENTFNAEIIDMKFSEDRNFLYFITREGLHKIDTEHKTLEFVADGYDESAKKIIRADLDKIYLAGRGKIIAVDAKQTEQN